MLTRSLVFFFCFSTVTWYGSSSKALMGFLGLLLNAFVEAQIYTRYTTLE